MSREANSPRRPIERLATLRRIFLVILSFALIGQVASQLVT
jgi:hypothetical protein